MKTWSDLQNLRTTIFGEVTQMQIRPKEISSTNNDIDAGSNYVFISLK